MQAICPCNKKKGTTHHHSRYHHSLDLSFVQTQRSLLTMNFKDRLLGRSSRDDGSARDSLALPRFSFEGDGRWLLSTQRLFLQWDQEESGYEAGRENMEEGLRKGEEIIVGLLGVSWHCH